VSYIAHGAGAGATVKPEARNPHSSLLTLASLLGGAGPVSARRAVSSTSVRSGNCSTS
jgi:hypothetical protein